MSTISMSQSTGGSLPAGTSSTLNPDATDHADVPRGLRAWSGLAVSSQLRSSLSFLEQPHRRHTCPSPTLMEETQTGMNPHSCISASMSWSRFDPVYNGVGLGESVSGSRGMVEHSLLCIRLKYISKYDKSQVSSHRFCFQCGSFSECLSECLFSNFLTE